MEIKTTSFEKKVKQHQIAKIKNDLNAMLDETKSLYDYITEGKPEKEELYVLAVNYTSIINEILKTQKLLEEKSNASKHNEKQG